MKKTTFGKDTASFVAFIGDTYGQKPFDKYAASDMYTEWEKEHPGIAYVDWRQDEDVTLSDDAADLFCFLTDVYGEECFDKCEAIDKFLEWENVHPRIGYRDWRQIQRL